MASSRSAGYYRQEAERCRALAETVKEPMARASYILVAETYDRLAGQIAELENFGYRPPDSK